MEIILIVGVLLVIIYLYKNRKNISKGADDDMFDDDRSSTHSHHTHCDEHHNSHHDHDNDCFDDCDDD